MAEEFAGMSIAVMVVTASIILAGIMIGLGRAFRHKRIEQFGLEELIQSIVNAAIIGSFAVIVAMATEVSSSLARSGACGAVPGTLVDQLICVMGSTKSLLFSMSSQLIRTMDIIGYYQGLQLDFGAFSIAPFANLSVASGTLSAQALALNVILILAGLNGLIALFIKQNALILLFPLGLVLRTVFATRRVGGFLIALSIGLYLFYPSFVMIFPAPTLEINNSVNLMSNFTNNSAYAAMPIVDLNDNNAIAKKLDIMSGRCMQLNLLNSSHCNATERNMTVDFSGDLTMISQSNDEAISKSLLQTVIAPIFSLLITAVFVKELSSLLGGELGIKTIAAI